MKNILPAKLQAGDTIGIVSPSMPLVKEQEEQFNKGVEYFNNLGFEIKFGKYIRSNKSGYGALPEEKAEDINEMFSDKNVKAIVCSQGGITCNNCLDFINWKIIENNPKIFLGISDITVLLNSIHHKTGLITFHGNDIIWGYGRSSERYETQEFKIRLINGEAGNVNPIRNRISIRDGIAEGKLMGGNLRCLLKLAGTEYFPDFGNSILFLEDIGISPPECDCCFNQLNQIGVFNKIKGIIVGYIDGLDNSNSIESMENVLLKVSGKFPFPIIKTYEIGHNCQNTVLPIGAKVKIDTVTKNITILDRFIT